MLVTVVVKDLAAVLTLVLCVIVVRISVVAIINVQVWKNSFQLNLKRVFPIKCIPLKLFVA
jgi:hypothetical protein